MIRTLIVASSPVVRAGLEALLARHPAVSIVGSVLGAEGIAEAVEEHEPQIVVLATDGSGARSSIMPLALSPDAVTRAPSMVVLADAPSAAWAADALRAGVRAVLPRDASAEEIIAALDAAAVGLVTLSHELAAQLVAQLESQSSGRATDATPAAIRPAPNVSPPAQPLSPREIEVLGTLAEGLANKNIAARLGISEHTVKTHVASILAKLDADSRAEAVAIGARLGLILL